MSGVNVDEEYVAYDGIVASGAHGTAAAPTNATGALDVTWTDHGLTTAAGVTRSQPVGSTVRRAWQRNRKMRSLVTEAAVRWVFILVQTSKANVELFHGTTMVNGKLIVDPSREWPQIAFDFDTIDGDNVIREYAPNAKVVEVGDQVAVAGDTWGWPITVEAEYDAGIDGYTVQFYSEFEASAVPTITSALPSGQGVGEIVTLIGTGFTGATVTVGGVAAPDIDIISDTKLYVTLPAGSAGSAPIIVTNAAGASSPKAYTRA